MFFNPNSSFDYTPLWGRQDGNSEPNAFEIRIADANLQLCTGTTPDTNDIAPAARESVILEIVIDEPNVSFYKNGRHIKTAALAADEATRSSLRRGGTASRFLGSGTGRTEPTSVWISEAVVGRCSLTTADVYRSSWDWRSEVIGSLLSWLRPMSFEASTSLVLYASIASKILLLKEPISIHLPLSVSTFSADSYITIRSIHANKRFPLISLFQIGKYPL